MARNPRSIADMPLNGKFVANLDAFLMPMQAVLTAFLFDLCIYFTVGNELVLEKAVMELICLAIVFLFFGLSFWMVWLLERL